MSKRALRIQDLCGPFRVARFVASGRTTELYEAVHEPTGDKVTLTILSAEAAGDDAERQRFQAETELFGALDHPNILRKVGSGEVGGVPWRAMELAAGGSLRARLQASLAPMSSAVALCFARQIADALGALHGAGAAHGELSPESILLTDIDEVKLADLGVAPRIRGGGAISAGERTGEALDYVAPEQLRGGPVDALVDIFAAGAMLREMLEGSGAPRASRALPDFLRDLIEKATAPDPGERYSSMAALGDAVNDAWNDLLEQNREGAELEQALAMLAQALGGGGGGEEEGEDPATAADLEALLQKLASAVRVAGEDK
jgi:serine/threonine-protein kinase